jgi:hypothetical protein
MPPPVNATHPVALTLISVSRTPERFPGRAQISISSQRSAGTDRQWRVVSRRRDPVRRLTSSRVRAPGYESASQGQTQVNGAPEWTSTQPSALSSGRPSESAAVALVRASCGRVLRPDPGVHRDNAAFNAAFGVHVPATLEPRDRNRPDDPLVRRFQVSRVGSSAERTVAAILGRHPLERTADKCARLYRALTLVARAERGRIAKHLLYG